MSLGGSVQGVGSFRAGRNAGIPGDPGGGIHLDLEKGRFGVGVSRFRSTLFVAKPL